MSQPINTHMEECPHCLGTKNVWNGEDFIVCPICHGAGELEFVNSEEDDESPEFLNLDDLLIDPPENYDEDAFP